MASLPCICAINKSLNGCVNINHVNSYLQNIIIIVITPKVAKENEALHSFATFTPPLSLEIPRATVKYVCHHFRNPPSKSPPKTRGCKKWLNSFVHLPGTDTEAEISEKSM